MCIKKRKINILKKVFLTSNISELLSGPIPVKYKGPGYPTISCIIGQTTINRALLDLGASINMLPFLCISNSGWATPMNFIVLETQPMQNPKAQTPVISV